MAGGEATARAFMGLEGKRFMVVGGGQGMGEATVRLLARFGAHVGVVDLLPERAERVAAEAAQQGVKAVPVAVDVTDDDALIAAISRLQKDLGPIDGLATIVGMAGWGSLVDMTMETWDNDHRRNLRYFFLAAREIAKGLLDRRAPGSMVCVASVDGLRSAPNHAAYGAAKAGLINLVRTMAVEWSPDGIRVNCVAPGGVVTPRIPLWPDEEVRNKTSNNPMRRRGTVDEIAKAVTFFLSDQAAYVTGQTLAVDGGATAQSPFDVPPANRPKPGGTLGLAS
jgi:NAD(P)-dependent dehydrogenase (short-subunit alcohol dehydrogenase family)